MLRFPRPKIHSYWFSSLKPAFFQRIQPFSTAGLSFFKSTHVISSYSYKYFIDNSKNPSNVELKKSNEPSSSCTKVFKLIYLYYF